MLLKTHLAFGLFVAILALYFIQPANQMLFTFLVLLGAAFPDIDHPKSRLGQMAWPIAYMFEHRGFFHSFFAIALFPAAIYLLSGSLTYTIAFLLGYASHILADAFNTQGIMPLHPIIKFRFRGFLRTGAFYEYAIMFLLMAVNIFSLFFILPA
jgi:inner membrane protein